MDKSLVSIIIPTLNREKFLLETLNSVKNQTYENWECIVVDDDSTDNTEDCVLKFVESDNRFNFYKRPNDLIKGANSCRNFGFMKSKGVYINWFDSDDIMHPDFILKKITGFKENIDCVISKSIFFRNNIDDISGKEQRTFLTDNLIEDFVKLNVSWYLPDPMWRRDFLIEKSLFSENLLKGQDRDFHIRMLFEKPKIKILDDYLTFYRQHDETISNKYSKVVILSYFESINNRIKLFETKGISKDLKLFFLKEQLKNYPFLYIEKNILYKYLQLFKQLYVFDFKYFIWFVKFITATLTFNLFNKGSVILKG